MVVYKLTDANGYTRRGQSGETLWSPGVTRETTGAGELCGPGWTHAYEHPLLALLHDPIHGNYGGTARLWKIRAYGEIELDGKMKLGATQMTCLCETEKPTVTLERRVAYGILCTGRVCDDPAWQTWAWNWLMGVDRTEATARLAAALHAVSGATEAEVAANAVVWVARAAAWVARASWSAARAPWSVARASWSAVWVAARAAETAAKHDIDLIACAEQAMEF